MISILYICFIQLSISFFFSFKNAVNILEMKNARCSTCATEKYFNIHVLNLLILFACTRESTYYSTCTSHQNTANNSTTNCSTCRFCIELIAIFFIRNFNNIRVIENLMKIRSYKDKNLKEVIHQEQIITNFSCIYC